MRNGKPDQVKRSLEEVAPIPGTLGHWAASLRSAARAAVTPASITRIVEAQMRKAEAGDLSACRFIMDFFCSDPMSPPPDEAPVVIIKPPGPLDERLKDDPRWFPATCPRTDPKFNRIVESRRKAGLPLTHPNDPPADLD